MRLLVLKSNDFPVAGHMRLVEMYVAHLNRARVEPVLVHVNAEGKQPTLLETSDRTQDMEHHVIEWRGIRNWRSAAARLREIVRETGADLVTSNDMRSDFVCRMAGARKGLGVPWTSFVHGWTGLRHIFHGKTLRLDQTRYYLYECIDRWCVRGADEVWVGSKACGDNVRKSLPRRVPIKVLMNAAEPYYMQSKPGRAAEIRASLGLPEGTLLVGTLGRMAMAKGHALLARAVVESGRDNLVAVLLGFGEEEENLKRLAAEPKYRGRVILPGEHASLNEVPDWLEALDIFCFPSLQESLPVALLEAMLKDNAIAASNTGDIADVLEHGECGLLFEPGDVAGMAAQLRVLADDDERRIRLRDRAKQRALSYFTAPRYAKDVEDASVALVGERSADVSRRSRA